MSKKTCQKKHACKRALQRYGINLGRDKYNKLISMIGNEEKGRAVFLERQSNRITLWALYYEDEWLMIVYDTMRKSIASVLPRENLDRFKEKLQ